MIDPNAQGELILSFVIERRQQLTHSLAVAAGIEMRPRAPQRALAFAGDTLINLGTALKRRGHLEYTRPAVATTLETK